MRFLESNSGVPIHVGRGAESKRLAVQDITFSTIPVRNNSYKHNAKK